jgi:hypothetical protein
VSFRSPFELIYRLESIYDLASPTRLAKSKLWREYYLKIETEIIRYVIVSDMSGNLILEDTTNNQILFTQSAKN